MRVAFMAFGCAVWWGGAAAAQAPGGPPPVEAMTCEQMYAEMAAGGQVMKQQLDPSFAANAQAMRERATDPKARAEAAAQQAGVSAACSNPLTMAACKAVQAGMMADAKARQAEGQAQMAQMMGQLNASMAGLDQQRMMAIAKRVETLKCPKPAAP
jgi:hypothetical protein